MRSTTRVLAVAAVVALCLGQAQAREKEKDKEAKGKIPEATKKRIEENKIRQGVVIIGIEASGASQHGHFKPDGEGEEVMLEEGDIITKVDDKPVKSAADYYKLLSGDKERKVTVVDVNTDKATDVYIKPQGGKIGITFEVIPPPAS